jgi:hypothetical protein
VDVRDLAKLGVMTTLVLVVDGKVKHAGAPIPAPQVVEKLITED